jgi:hypothetical protein
MSMPYTRNGSESGLGRLLNRRWLGGEVASGQVGEEEAPYRPRGWGGERDTGLFRASATTMARLLTGALVVA